MSDGHPVESKLDALHGVTRKLMHAGTEQAICNVAVEGAATVFDASLCGLWLYDEAATELQQAAETEQAARQLGTEVVYQPGNSLSWEAFRTDELRHYRDTDESHAEYSADPEVGSELILPLGEYGVLNVATQESEAFTTADEQLGELLAEQIEVALINTERAHALELKNDRLEEVLGIVSHDLRNPLTVADGNLELAQQECSSDRLSTVADALDRMDTLIDELLMLGEQGYVVDTRTTVPLDDIARRAWSSVPTSEASLKTEQTADIFCDEQRLLQVFENLFRNAIEHAGEDVTIRVGKLETMQTVTRVSAANESDGFYVSDDGPGIPPEEWDDVFDTGHSADGTGLGLSIAQRIVEAHGWEISVSSGVNGGARFEVVGGAKSVSPFDSG